MSSYSVVIIEQSPLIRHGLKAVLKRMNVVGEADACHRGKQLIASLEPDVIIVNATIPGCSPESVQAWVATLRSGCFVVLSPLEDHETMRGFIAAGVRGFIGQTTPALEVARLIAHAARGGLALSTTTQDTVLLSRSEAAATSYLVGPGTVNECSEAMEIRRSTFQTLLRRARIKLGVDSRESLRLWAVGIGLKSPLGP